MVNSRTNNSIRNTSYGFLVTLVNTILSFITRTFFIKYIGIDFLGLNGLFTEVIAVISLAEMGVGMAIVYSLYKPLNENDHEKISQLMSLYKKAYNCIAIVTFVIGLCICPFVRYIVKDVDFPDFYIMIVFMMFVIRTSSSYLFSYKTSLLSADQKQYKVSLINVFVNLLFTILIIASFYLCKNYFLYLSLLIVQSLTQNLIISRLVDHLYPYLDLNKQLSKDERKEVFSNIRNIFIKKVSWIVTSSTDNILISTLVSTVQVGYYSNYMILFKLVRTIKNQLGSGFQASLGNLTVNAHPEKCINVLFQLTFINTFLGILLTSGLLAISSLFITIWLGEQYVISSAIITIAIFNIYIELCFDPLWQNLEVSGLFKQDRNIALLGTTINLLVSIILGAKLGMGGILMGTTCTLILQLILKTRLLFKHKFNSSASGYYFFIFKIICCFGIVLLSQILVLRIISSGNLFVDFLLKGLLSLVLSIGCFYVMFRRSPEWGSTKVLLNKYIFNRFRK